MVESFVRLCCCIPLIILFIHMNKQVFKSYNSTNLTSNTPLFSVSFLVCAALGRCGARTDRTSPEIPSDACETAPPPWAQLPGQRIPNPRQVSSSARFCLFAPCSQVHGKRVCPSVFSRTQVGQRDPWGGCTQPTRHLGIGISPSVSVGWAQPYKVWGRLIPAEL